MFIIVNFSEMGIFKSNIYYYHFYTICYLYSPVKGPQYDIIADDKNTSPIKLTIYEFILFALSAHLTPSSANNVVNFSAFTN